MGGVGQELVFQAVGPGQFQIGQLQAAIKMDEGQFLLLQLADQFLGMAAVLNHGDAAEQTPGPSWIRTRLTSTGTGTPLLCRAWIG